MIGKRTSLHRTLRRGAVLAACLLATGCSAPFGARKASPQAVRRALTANVLSSDELSDFSRIVLHRQNLTDAFEDWYAYVRSSLPTRPAKRRRAVQPSRERRANP